jgi:hypothetical protein
MGRQKAYRSGWSWEALKSEVGSGQSDFHRLTQVRRQILLVWTAEVERFPLPSGGAIPVDPAASKEAVTHHALGKEKKDDCQDDYKQELSNS